MCVIQTHCVVRSFTDDGHGIVILTATISGQTRIRPRPDWTRPDSATGIESNDTTNANTIRNAVPVSGRLAKLVKRRAWQPVSATTSE